MPSLKGIIEVQSGLGLGFFFFFMGGFLKPYDCTWYRKSLKIIQSGFFEKYLQMWCKRRRMDSSTEEKSSSTAVSVRSAH